MKSVKRQEEYQYKPFIVKELEDRRGGLSVSLKNLRKDVGVVPPGAYIGIDEETGMGHILKIAELAENAAANAVNLRVKKAHQLVVGDIVTSKDAVEGARAFSIESIDTSNAEFDVVRVRTTLGVALPAGSHLIGVKAEDTEGGESELPYTPLGLTKREIITTDSHASVGVLTKGTVTVATLAFGAPQFFRDALIHITYEI